MKPIIITTAGWKLSLSENTCASAHVLLVELFYPLLSHPFESLVLFFSSLNSRAERDKEQNFFNDTDGLKGTKSMQSHVPILVGLMKIYWSYLASGKEWTICKAAISRYICNTFCITLCAYHIRLSDYTEKKCDQIPLSREEIARQSVSLTYSHLLPDERSCYDNDVLTRRLREKTSPSMQPP